jgi:transposase
MGLHRHPSPFLGFLPIRSRAPFRLVLCRDARASILKSLGPGLAKRIGMRRAKVAVARKLAVIMHRIWSDQSEYRWTAIPPTAA